MSLLKTMMVYVEHTKVEILSLIIGRSFMTDRRNETRDFQKFTSPRSHIYLL